MNPSTIELTATILFGCAILHTFSVKRFEVLAKRFPHGSVLENVFHFLGEVEAVFGLWAGAFVVTMAFYGDAVEYLEHTNYTEPAFVFVILTIAATRPVLILATRIIQLGSKLLPLSNSVSFFVVALIIGPLLGSFITEPAAMTVTALILKERYYDRGISTRLMYGTLGVLFVNVSIGGTLTHFAAPPVLMVASTWDWDIAFMASHFGWKSAIAVVINTAVLAFVFREDLRKLAGPEAQATAEPEAAHPPMWVIALHVVFLAGVVVNAHHMVVFMAIFLFFLGVATATVEYQEPLKLKEGLLVGFFLAGLVTLGGPQKWWLQPLLGSLDAVPLFLGATGLTAVTDNAALTFLGSLVEGISDVSKYALVAGAVAGGGLTVIANAPNPAGFGILKSSFGDTGISPIGLLGGALLPTFVAMGCLWFLPSL